MLKSSVLAFALCFVLLACGGTDTANPNDNPDGDNPAIDGDGEDCPTGTLHCPCYGNGTCNEGLACQDNLCLASSNDGDGDTDDSPPADGDNENNPPVDGDGEIPDGDTLPDGDSPADGDDPQVDGDDEESPTDGDEPQSECVAGLTVCSEDRYGFHPCGDDDNGLGELGQRVPCDPSQACTDGICAQEGCQPAELFFVLDRSSSMLAADTWQWVKETFLAAIDERDHVNNIGFRQFPSEACGAGETLPMSLDNAETIANAITDPAVDSSTPIAASLQDLEDNFGDPNPRQAVVLITDGEETCEDDTNAIAAARELFMKGIFVHVVAVTTTANRVFLDEVAFAGGTGQSRLVTDGESFATALQAIYEEINARRCEPDNLCCLDDGCGLVESRIVCGGACECSEEQSACVIDKEYSFACFEGDVYWYDCQGALAQKKEDCKSCTCTGDACDIDPEHYLSCWNNDVYWYDCKDNRREKQEDCGTCHCSAGVCYTDNRDSYACQDGNVYWYDCHGQLGQLKESCGHCPCEVDSCRNIEHYDTVCHDRDVYWITCNSIQSDKKEECGENGCRDGACIAK